MTTSKQFLRMAFISRVIYTLRQSGFYHFIPSAQVITCLENLDEANYVRLLEILLRVCLRIELNASCGVPLIARDERGKFCTGRVDLVRKLLATETFTNL